MSPVYSLPTGATRDDIAGALTASDPSQEVRDQLAALDRLEDWVIAERAKWTHAQSLTQIFDPESGADQRLPLTYDEAPNQPAEDNEPAEPAADDAEPRRTRREAILEVLSTDPVRTWKSSDIRQEMKRRGWASTSEYEDHMVMRTLTTMLKGGQVKRPKKGHYKLAKPPATETEDD